MRDYYVFSGNFVDGRTNRFRRPISICARVSVGEWRALCVRDFVYIWHNTGPTAGGGVCGRNDISIMRERLAAAGRAGSAIDLRINNIVYYGVSKNDESKRFGERKRDGFWRTARPRKTACRPTVNSPDMDNGGEVRIRGYALRTTGIFFLNFHTAIVPNTMRVVCTTRATPEHYRTL